MSEILKCACCGDKITKDDKQPYCVTCWEDYYQDEGEDERE